MKKIALVLFCVVSMSFAANAQKFGHINSEEIISLMAERDSAILKLQAYATELDETLQGMESEYNAKYAEYTRKQSEWTAAIRESKEKDIQDLIQRIQQFQQTAQQEMQQMQQVYMAPVYEKAQNAITKIAKENGLTYVFNLAAGSLIYFDEAGSLNLLPLAKKELGIPAEKVAPTQFAQPEQQQ